MSTRLLLIEDDSALARAIASALAQTGYGVEIAATAALAMRWLRESDFEAAILDLGLPDRDGLDLLVDLRAAGFGFPILILSARDALHDRVRGLDAGADDYLVKPFAVSELEARLRALLRRPGEHGQWRQVGLLRCDFAGSRALINNREIELTQREFAILGMLMRRAGKVVNKETLFEAVFPADSEASANALEVQISRIRQKIKSAGVSIRALRGLGYRIDDVSEDGPRPA
jgi:two-component system OmpR family response regulator